MRYYVAFGESSERNWWDWFNKPGFEHTYAWTAVSDFRCIGVEFNKDGLYAAYRECSALAMLDKVLCREDCTCVIEVEIMERTQYAARGLMNCVTTVKAFLGLPGCRVLTPWGLARKLLAHGGKLHYGRFGEMVRPVSE